MNTTSLAIIQRDELDTIQEAAKLLALSNYFDGKGNTPQAVAQIATKILAGREMGFGPFASVNGIHIIQGRPSVGANLLASAVKSSGRYDYRVREMTNDVCRIEFFEREGDKKESIGQSSFTKEDAVKAGTQNLVKFARNMLFARALSNGVRWFCPDVFCGNAVYVPEELGAEVDGEGNVVDVTPRYVEPTTPSGHPEIIEGKVDNPFEDVDFSRASFTAWTPPTDEEHAILSIWHTSADAYTWAVNVRACANRFEAENSMKKVAKENNMRFSAENKQAIFLAAIRHWNAKLMAHEHAQNGKIAA